MNDEQLVKKCLEKDALAQKQLFDFYSKRMMGVCLRYTRESEEAQEVLQLNKRNYCSRFQNTQKKRSSNISILQNPGYR